ncbi:gluconokinase [Paraglaciecola sp.]|uniref:gluconokinase n=1 Tax=Paraglaciecola sp. TaxID=1920173 RepID=UPI003EF9DBF7
MIYIVMGVSGCGKSTVGSLLADKLGLSFFDADDFHPVENVNKMASGQPLDDNDRAPWLSLLADKIVQWEQNGGAVLACSALKQTYRDLLCSTTNQVVSFIYLHGEKSVLHSRLTSRESHFMPDSLLDSQLQTLEAPTEALTVSIDNTLEQIISQILKDIN